jgi:hypothetical protein
MARQFEISLPTVESNFQGFSRLIHLAEETAGLSYTNITLDFRSASWFDANMCAPLGALLYRISRKLNTVNIVNIPAHVERILLKNSFLSNYGRAKQLDEWGTTIRYNRFEPKDDRYFGAYIERHFKYKAIPHMSSALHKKFWESIFEIFSNAVIHSETRMGIFTCGQFYPRKHRLDFSIADLGLGMRNVLKIKRGLDYSAEQAINWAMEGQNTTKNGPIPGGLGLKLLREFIKLNNGCIQVVSDKGFWEQDSEGKVITKAYNCPFPGTVVNIEINTAD